MPRVLVQIVGRDGDRLFVDGRRRRRPLTSTPGDYFAQVGWNTFEARDGDGHRIDIEDIDIPPEGLADQIDLSGA